MTRTDKQDQDEDAHPKPKQKAYEKQLARLQVELCVLQDWAKHRGLRIIVVFEGRDAAGKGGIIKAITERVSPRVFRVVALPAPTDREKTQLHIQRYLQHFPAAGEIVMFDRSWYNRAGVEYVMGFSTKEQRDNFLQLCPMFEKHVVDSGIILIKYWLEVSNEEQERRFKARIEDPLRQWKLSPMGEVVRVLAGAGPHARGHRHDTRAMVHRPVRRQEAGAPELHQPSLEFDSLQEAAARTRQTSQAIGQGEV